MSTRILALVPAEADPQAVSAALNQELSVGDVALCAVIGGDAPHSWRAHSERWGIEHIASAQMLNMTDDAWRHYLQARITRILGSFAAQQVWQVQAAGDVVNVIWSAGDPVEAIVPALCGELSS